MDMQSCLKIRQNTLLSGGVFFGNEASWVKLTEARLPVRFRLIFDLRFQVPASLL